MTRYANLKRNADIIALFLLHIPPKQIPAKLKLHHPELTLKIVYKVVEAFHVERNGEIRGNHSLEERK